MVLPFLVHLEFVGDPNNYIALGMFLVGILLVVVGIGYKEGRPRPRWLAMTLVAGLPVATSLISAAEPMWRICHRQDDGVTAARRVRGNGVELVWAPAGPGWPKEGNVDLDEAEKIASHLTADGLSLADKPQNIWRVPTVEEVVRSLTRNGQNAGGEWDPELRRAKYRLAPDKESPLWRVRSPVVYWWTSPRVPERSHEFGRLLEGVSLIVSYHGDVSMRYGVEPYDDIGFRAVKER